MRQSTQTAKGPRGAIAPIQPSSLKSPAGPDHRRSAVFTARYRSMTSPQPKIAELELTVPHCLFAQLRGHGSFIGLRDRRGPGRTSSGATNDGTPVSGGTRRRSSRVRTIKPMDPDGSVLNFSFAATLIRVRNRSKDLRRSITVDGAGRPDTASNASSETAKLIRRMPSRISKRIKSPSREETALDVPLISIPS